MDSGAYIDSLGDWEHLPGADLIRKGLLDRREGRVSSESLLVEVSASKLRRLGFEISGPLPALPEHALFQQLVAEDPTRAHSRYNALLRRLASFHHAAACVR